MSPINPHAPRRRCCSAGRTRRSSCRSLVSSVSRRASVFSIAVGRRSAAKMCRSVIVKGMEALLGESLLAARRYGVEGAVLESLGSLLIRMIGALRRAT